MPDSEDARYSMKAVTLATGLRAETLRAWERRYAIVAPTRDGGGRRAYTARDVARLRRLREATLRGHAIGKLVALTDADLDALLAERGEAESAFPAARALAARILDAADRFDVEECDQAIAMTFALLPLAAVVDEVLAPALRSVGERWHSGEFSVGQERLVSGSVRRQASAILNSYHATAAGPTIVFATFSGELHELGILMYAALAASHRIRVCYLGPDMPPRDIGEFAARVGAAAVAISILKAEDPAQSLRELAALRAHLPPGVEIWIGGRGGAPLAASPMLPAGSVPMAGHGDFESRIALLAAAGA